MHFSPVSDFPLFSKNFQTLRKIFTILPFPEKFHLQKFLMTFFIVIDHKFRISPIFPCFCTFPPVSRKLLFPRYFEKFSPLFKKNLPAFYILCVFRFPPYFDHDAFMHHAMHVLDVPGFRVTKYGPNKEVRLI